jgi:imidazoleglycerol-phosphate dehydratase
MLDYNIMNNTSYTIQKSSQTKVELKRTTAESDIFVVIQGSWLDQKIIPKKNKWNTGICFLNHMIQLICRRASLNIDVEFKCVLEQTFAQHVVWEDVGMVLGAGISQLLEKRRADGVQGTGFGVACIDEALSRCYLSFEGRTGCFIKITDSSAKARELVEDAKTQDVRQFFEGFSQGARCTLHLEIGEAFDSHHLWESTFRAFGEALGAALRPNDWRAGVIVGVKDAKD